MVVDMMAVCVRGDEKGVLTLCPTHGEVVTDGVCLLRRDLARLERLSYLIAQHILIPLLFPTCDGFVLRFREQKLRIGGFMVAHERRDQFASLSLVGIFPIIKTILERGRNSFAPADMMGDEACGRHARPLLLRHSFWTQCPEVVSVGIP